MHMHIQTDIQTDIHSGSVIGKSFTKLRARKEKQLNQLNRCLICEQNGTAMACQRCQTRIRQHLDDILQYRDIAAGQLQPGQSKGTRSTERPIGIRLDALDFIAGHDVLPDLESWERMFREEWGYAAWGPTTARRATESPDQYRAYYQGTIDFLREHMPRIAEHTAVDDFATEIRQLWYRTRNIAGQTPEQAYRVECPADTDEGECGHSLRFTTQDLYDEIKCKKCATTWTVWRLHLVAEAAGKSVWVDIEAAALRFSLHPATIRKWAKAGHITRHGNQYDLKTIRSYIELSKQQQRDLLEMSRT
jgi:hypothetical protein